LENKRERMKQYLKPLRDCGSGGGLKYFSLKNSSK
jgi:hypothetical protein